MNLLVQIFFVADYPQATSYVGNNSIPNMLNNKYVNTPLTHYPHAAGTTYKLMNIKQKYYLMTI